MSRPVKTFLPLALLGRAALPARQGSRPWLEIAVSIAFLRGAADDLRRAVARFVRRVVAVDLGQHRVIHVRAERILNRFHIHVVSRALPSVPVPNHTTFTTVVRR